MSKQSSETHGPNSSGRMSDTAAYSTRIQEAMRYDKLGSSDYLMVLTILRAIAQGWTEEQWKQEQQRTVSVLTKQPPDEQTPHADAANRYEQAIACFKDLVLWPW
jgi:endonuclease/exonuclease/phosphatase (EEP) superfamily protein YafD